MFYKFVMSALCSGFTRIKQRQKLQNLVLLIFLAVTKINTRQIQPQSICKMKHVQKNNKNRYYIRMAWCKSNISDFF